MATCECKPDDSIKMYTRLARYWIIGFLVAIIILILFVSLRATPNIADSGNSDSSTASAESTNTVEEDTLPSNSAGENQGNDLPLNATVILAVIGGGALLIERLIEGLWILVGIKYPKWPLRLISKRLDAYTDELNRFLVPYLKEMKNNLSEADEATISLIGGYPNRDVLIKEVQDLLLNAKSLTPDRAVVQSVTGRALGITAKAGRWNTDLDDKAKDAKKVLDKAENLLATLQDNPGRRLISLMLGSLIAIPFALILRLDVLIATLGTTIVYQVPFIEIELPGLGIAITGVLMGVGATPTHEVIKTLQEIKKNQKASTQQSL